MKIIQGMFLNLSLSSLETFFAVSALPRKTKSLLCTIKSPVWVNRRKRTSWESSGSRTGSKKGPKTFSWTSCTETLSWSRCSLESKRVRQSSLSALTISITTSMNWRDPSLVLSASSRIFGSTEMIEGSSTWTKWKNWAINRRQRRKRDSILAVQSKLITKKTCTPSSALVATSTTQSTIVLETTKYAKFATQASA